MAITKKDVEHVARLARLDLTEDEKTMFVEQLSKILDHAAKVTALDTDGVEPTAHAIKLVNVMRPDEPEDSLDPAEALANAPHEESGHFRVPRVIEDEA